MIRSILLTVGLNALYWYPMPAASDGNCVLDHCETAHDPVTHPTEQNVLSTPLQTCSTAPMTGFYRDGYCRTGNNDRGIHVVCAEMTKEFLAYTKSKGNDLSSPSPQYGFPGLKSGDKWCLCADRWDEANRASVAPNVVLQATSKAALDRLTLATLESSAQDR